jgi:hypothetical protein
VEIRPVDLPLLRNEIAAMQSVAVGKYGVMRGMGASSRDATNAARLAQLEEKALRLAELYHVSRGMGALARAAALTLPYFNLLPEDMPSPAGFMYFAETVNSKDTFVPLRAASWTTMEGDSVHLAMYFDKSWSTSLAAGRAADLMRNGPQILPLLAFDVPFSVEKVDAVSFLDKPVALEDSGGRGLFVRVLKTAWLLMGQTLACVEDAKYDRAAWRRITKLGMEPPRVRVITLRRTALVSTDQSDREWHHQWIVRGHWRQQWLPSRSVHRPTWIAPHIKGPEGAPMLGGEKVYALKR